MSKYVSVGVQSYTGAGPNQWWVYVQGADGVKFEEGPFTRAIADRIQRHYEIFESIVSDAVRRELRDVLGVIPARSNEKVT